MFEVDHIIEIANGGTNAPDNLQLLCPTCHMQKTTMNRVARGVQRRNASPSNEHAMEAELVAEFDRHKQMLMKEERLHKKNVDAILVRKRILTHDENDLNMVTDDAPRSKAPKRTNADTERQKEIIGAFWASHSRDADETRDPPSSTALVSITTMLQTLGSFTPAINVKEVENVLRDEGVVIYRKNAMCILQRDRECVDEGVQGHTRRDLVLEFLKSFTRQNPQECVAHPGATVYASYVKWINEYANEHKAKIEAFNRISFGIHIKTMRGVTINRKSGNGSLYTINKTLLLA